MAAKKIESIESMQSRKRTKRTASQAKPLRLRNSAVRFDGSAVRLPQEVEEIIHVEDPEEKKKTDVRIRRNREKMLRMSPAYVGFLTVCCFVMLLLCVNYLRLETKIQANIDTVSSLSSEIEELKSENAATQERITLASDINQIYKTATEELGMVYPDDGQVIYYDQTEREYVQQYESIPEN